MEITIELETITPLFIAGADQRNIENEGLRVPSLRGLLRWWFRAIMGGMVSFNNLLKELESKVFGSTVEKSNVRILSVVDTQPSEINVPPSLRYLWFSIDIQRKRDQRLQCYPPRTKFKIKLISYDEDGLRIALGCLWALIYLGGAGARMRRGAGSLKVNNVSGSVPYEFVFDGRTVSDAKSFMESNLVKIFGDFKKYAGRDYSPQINPKFAVLSHARVSLVKKLFDKWDEALSSVGREYQQFRQRLPLKNRYIFGLPIIAGQVSVFKDLRQASPLFIGVMDLNDGYAVRLVKFYTAIHEKYIASLGFLEQNLDDLDGKITEKLGEVEVKIPEVD